VRDIDGVLIPEMEEGAAFSFRDQIMLNAPPEAKKIERRRDKMKKVLQEEWNDRKRAGK
jgi:hypothetical protein